jgi:hypothetical protein
VTHLITKSSHWTGARPFWMAASSLLKGGQEIGLTRRGKESKLVLVVEHQGIPIGGQVASAQ